MVFEVYSLGNQQIKYRDVFMISNTIGQYWRRQSRSWPQHMVMKESLQLDTWLAASGPVSQGLFWS